jgi:hypothetical protein
VPLVRLRDQKIRKLMDMFKLPRVDYPKGYQQSQDPNWSEVNSRDNY